jgi:diguanylate cyclase (GGDEF)-like protein
LLSFHPGELRFNDHSPNIVITARSRESRLVTMGTGDPTPSIKLGYLDPFVAFEFVGLDFTSPDKDQHRYRLVGFDDAWIEADRYRRAIYTNLPAGRYSFQVEASNNDNVWNLRGTSVDLTVIPPPWFSWWAYVLYVALGVCAVLFYLRAQRRKLQFEADQRILLEEEVHVRTRELAERNDELTDANTKLAEASITDSLTGLRNRRYVDQFIAAEIALIERRMLEGGRLKDESDKRDSARMMFFMMIDLDGFKLINDNFGHHAGDLALVEVKDRLLSCCRQSDSVVRWGGDEFMIIGHATAFHGAKVLAERIREAIADKDYEVEPGRWGHLTASIGVTPYPFAPNRVNFVSWEQVAGVADQAAYIAKANGRDMWVSIAGTEDTAPEDFPTISSDMVMLLSEGKLLIDTSTDETLSLPGGVRSMPKPVRR